MKRLATLAILAVAPLLTGALWMDDQPSFKTYEAPVLAPPADSVPTTGRGVVSPQGEFRNPASATGESQAQGRALFAINCAFCHGMTPAQRGPVGQKLKPPPPGQTPISQRELAERIIADALPVRFQIQLHKVIWPPSMKGV